MNDEIISDDNVSPIKIPSRDILNDLNETASPTKKEIDDFNYILIEKKVSERQKNAPSNRYNLNNDLNKMAICK